jgi:2-dehydro-3-deoxygluconokinase
MWKVAAIGECMLELSNPLAKPLQRNMQLQFSYGGDTLNTAVYLARLGVECAYVTALGDDPYSEWLLQEWEKEQVDTAMVMKMPNRVPGLYVIQTDDEGERSFHYWRKNAPARELFADEKLAQNIFDQLNRYDVIYLSGITLSLFDDTSLECLFVGLTNLREAGTLIAFDGNYRPAGWASAEKARSAFQRVCAIADLVMPTFDDEAALFGDQSPAETASRLHSYGIGEVVVKQGAEGVFVSEPEKQYWVPTTPVEKITDSTAAGDSFNAAYLAARANGLSPAEAAATGNRLAGSVIQHSGAIISESAMPTFKFQE